MSPESLARNIRHAFCLFLSGLRVILHPVRRFLHWAILQLEAKWGSNPGLTGSAILHLLLLFILLVDLPSLWRKNTPSIVPVVVTITQRDTPKEMVRPTPEKEVKKPDPKPISPVKRIKNKPDAPKPPKPKVVKKPESKKQAKPEKAEKQKKTVTPKKPDPKREEPKTPSLDMDALLKNLQEDSEPTSPAAAPRSTMETATLANKYQAIIRRQVRWTPPIGAQQFDKVIIVLEIRLNADGSIRAVSVDEQTGPGVPDASLRAIAESARRAVQQVGRFEDLDPNDYDIWDHLLMEFDPRNFQ